MIVIQPTDVLAAHAAVHAADCRFMQVSSAAPTR